MSIDVVSLLHLQGTYMTLSLAKLDPPCFFSLSKNGFCLYLFDLILYVQVSNLSVMSGRVFLG